MMSTSERMRKYTGPALFSGGFRPFFLLAGIWSALAMALWIAWFTGGIDLPAVFDPFSWHVHEMLFGFGAAALAGFLLTAVPNWTGQLPVAGLPLAALAALWLAGRVAVMTGAALGPVAVMVIDAAFLIALALLLGREIVRADNRRNLIVIAFVLALAAANLGFHWVAGHGGAPYQGWPARLGISVVVMLISLIGGRIVPSFTRNWLAARGPGPLPTPAGRFDVATLIASGAALALWTAAPEAKLSGIALLAAGLLQLARLGRWRGLRTFAEPLVTILHLAYLFLPLGFLLLGSALVDPARVLPAAGLHAWLAGGVGLMTLAVMTRASLGHTGRPLHAGARELAIYAPVLVAAIARIVAGLGGPDWLLHLAAGGWVLGFGLYALLYAPILARPRGAARKPSRAPRPA